MVYTSYFGNIKNLPKDYVPVSIARWTPKWFTGLRCSALAPSVSLLEWWRQSSKSQKDIETYTRIYQGQLNKMDAHKTIAYLRKLTEGKTPVLVCFEKPGEFCHRHIVTNWLKKYQINCREV